MADESTLNVVVTQTGVNEASASLDKLTASATRAQTATAVGHASYAQQAADMALIDDLAGRRKISEDELYTAEAARNRLEQAHMLTTEQNAAFTAASTLAMEAQTAAVKVNTLAHAANAGAVMNSRAQYSLMALVTDAATGQFSRMRREVAALVNETGTGGGIFKGIMSGLSGGAGALGVSMGVLAGGIAIVVATLGAYAIGAHEVDEENKAIARSLALSGNAFDTSTIKVKEFIDQLRIMNGGAGGGSSIVQSMLGSGMVFDAQFKTVAADIQNFAQLTGDSADKAAAAFIKLYTDPISGMKAFTAQGYEVSTAEKEHIKTLVEEGQTSQAFAVIEATIADQTKAKLAEVNGAIGDNISWWDRVKVSASEGWTAIFGGGVSKLTDAQKSAIDTMTELNDAVANRNKLLSEGKTQAADAMSVTVANLTAQLAGDRAVLAAGDAVDAQKAAAAQLSKDKTASDDAEAAATVRAYTATQKSSAAIAHNTAIYAEWLRTHKDATAQQLADAQQTLRQGNEEALNKIHVKHVKKAPGISADATLGSYVDTLTKGSTDSGDNSPTAVLTRGLMGLDDAYNKAIKHGDSYTNAMKKVAQGEAALVAKFNASTAVIEAQEAAYDKAVAAEVAANKVKLNQDVASLSMGDREAAQQTKLNQIKAQGLAIVTKLESEKAKAGADINEINHEIDTQKKKTKELTDQQIAYYHDVTAAQGNWETGAKKAFANFEEQAADTAGQTQALFSDAFNGLTDALVTFVTTGKLNFKSLADSVIADLARMVLKAEEAAIFKAIAGSFAGGSDSGFGSAIEAANGGVFNSPSLSAYSGQVVDTPTPFKFAHGAGIFGEAGPEAIMPLSRGANGKLGVQAAGNNGGVVINIQDYSGGQKAETTQTPGGPGLPDIINIIVGKAVDAVNGGIARGGSTGKIMQQTFGLARKGMAVS